ncbi:MAG: PDZ domain-containing protein [Lachnospiraceae bacterium]|jgi:serine protease Do|nr:PDZ domain-containing protein [Lachnospiraceae bacterium]
MTDMNKPDSFYHTCESSPEGTPAPYRPRSKTFSRSRVIALILCCSVLFGGICFGSAWALRGAFSSDASTPSANAPSNPSQPSNPSSLALKMAKTEEDALTIPEITAKASPSVVEITTESVQTGTMLQQYISSGAGSGVIVTDDGYIITNHHVIENATRINVTLQSGEVYPATLVGLDDQLDVALLKIEASGLTPASIGTSSDLIVGQTVVAIGNPLGQLGGTVTDGIISALDRSITLDGQTMSLLQTNAAINPGNSGGGLFNAQGNLIGLVVAKSSGTDVEGLGFAIPVDNIVTILEDLKTYGYVKGRVSLGVSLLDINSDQMAWMYRVSEQGIYIYSITEGGAADQAGLLPGDRVLSINNQSVSSIEEIKTLLKEVSVGDTLTIEISRTGQVQTVSVTAGEYIPQGIQSLQNNGNL